MRAIHLGLVGLLLLPGCATLIDGTTQVVAIRTAPVGAACTVRRNGMVLAQIAATPASFTVRRERQTILVTCRKPGWDPTSVLLPYRFTGVTAGNFPLGGFIGIVVDEASRANYSYEEDTTILLAPHMTRGMPQG